jgi:probable HAF family extracellular repeat protein
LADGTSIIGAGWSDDSSFALYRWTQATGIVDLGDGNTGSINPLGVSADGSVIIGSANRFIGSTLLVGATEAFRWTQETGFVGLGVLPGASVFSSAASGVSADGEVIVGRSSFTDSGGRAFIWTQATGMVSLGLFRF